MNRIKIIVLVVCLLFSGALTAGTLQERLNSISKFEMQSVMEFLSHDLLEGRGPATTGGNIAELYMQSLFKLLDFFPGAGQKYFQPFNLNCFTIKSLDTDIGYLPMKYRTDVVGSWVGEEEQFSLESDAVFVGFGIKAALWNWDDYKDSDVKGKIVIARVNDPGMFLPDIFEGKTLTFYGRWTYHVEEAARRGAAGILLIHTDESAGYNWDVVKNSWSGEEVYLQSDLTNSLKFRGWIRESQLRKALAEKKINLEELYIKSLDRKFKPIPLDLKIALKGTCTQRVAVNNNVIAIIPGKSTKKIVLSAHIDHLGKGEATNSFEDTIFNGAIDNASAVTAMTITAKILKEFQAQLNYTIVILACQSEEAGLKGSKYYVESLSPQERADIIANINFESTPVWGKSVDFMAIGGHFSTLEDTLKGILAKEGLQYSTFSLANLGLMYRSDQFSFARANIPAIWLSAGENDASGQKLFNGFWKTIYHTVKDEYNPDWPLDGMQQTIKMVVLLIDELNRTQVAPTWKGQLTFPIDK